MSKKAIFYIVFFVALSAMFVGYNAYVIKDETGSYYGKEKLPYLGSPGHEVQGFSFVNQEGKTITKDSVKGKFYVAEYFFTTCTGICPRMNENMEKVYEAYKDDPNFRILSHTVDPEYDSVPILKAYAEKHHADAKNWWFLTGSKKMLYKLARESYLVDDGHYTGDEDFVHTQWFALVDGKGRIRGLYEGTKKSDINKLIKDIDRLRTE
ncbi:electron transport protein SCO1/SenC [Chitinophaga caeni]|uniref:Electron transport protein SCO1/SenC n=1 Tax=Chitinophaga caeni TaxID=2029983 RepID=A0A291QR60_9BACT|nr:SCO family protein [Chitinophaga caeni]ATL46383.1 electron transport protein SCO1/SenC [Chitinophaga caeni]